MLFDAPSLFCQINGYNQQHVCRKHRQERNVIISERLLAFNPITLYNKAVRAVPSVKYALGVAGIVAAGAMALAVSKGNAKVAILSFVAVMIGMCLLVVFAAAANKMGRWPGFVLLWSVTILFVCMLTMTVTALAFGAPGNWAKLIGAVADNPTQSSKDSKQGNASDAGKTAKSAPPPIPLSGPASASTTGKCAPAFAGVSVGGNMSNTINCPSTEASATSTSASVESETKK